MASSLEYKHFLHDRRLCVGCKSKDADTLAGRWYCRACSDRRNAKIRAKRDPAKDKARRDARRSAGLCVHCGQPAEGGYVVCSRCREQQIEQHRKYRERRKERKET